MDKSVEYIKERLSGFTPDIALVLGSAQGQFASGLRGIEIPYGEIPGFKKSTVEGHKGSFLFCEFEGKKLVIAQGRVHFYEGGDINSVVLPVKVFKKLGVKVLVLTNAAGSTSKGYDPGDLVLIKDHINFMGINPLIGANDDTLGARFPDMSEIYNKTLRETAKKCADKIGINLKEGVYLGVTGPSYETPCEVRMFEKMGANLIGMSTVPEAIVANYCNLKVLGISTVTNYCTGVCENKLSHEEVLKIGANTAQKAQEFLKTIIKELQV